MKLELVIDNRVVDMVQLQQMLECSRPFVVASLNVVDRNRLNVNGYSQTDCDEARNKERVWKGGESRKHGCPLPSSALESGGSNGRRFRCVDSKDEDIISIQDQGPYIWVSRYLY